MEREIDDNLTDPEFFARGDIHAVFKQLRMEDPVHWTQGRLKHGFWSLTKYKDIQQVFGDPVTFSSQRGGSILPTSAQTEEVSESEKMRYGVELENTDPPRHSQLRKLMDPAFRKAIVRELTPTVRAIVEQIFEELVPRRDCDFVQDFAIRMPSEMICKIMGVPPEDKERMLQWTGMALSQEDASFQVEGSAFETKRQGYENMYKYCHALALEKRARPLSDVTSMIATSEIGGDKLSELELGWNTLMLVMAGLETARNAMSGGILALTDNPEQMDRLAADHSLTQSTVEEILRWTSPGTHLRRTATKDVELRGHTIREGDWVVMWLPSANRDEEVFRDPYRFDIARRPNRHIAFGYGPHHCIGRELARLEIELMLEEVLRRNLRFEITGTVERVKSNLVAGIKRMPVRIHQSSESVTAASGDGVGDRSVYAAISKKSP